MKTLRKYSTSITLSTTVAFTLSWLLVMLILPLQVIGWSGSHQVFSVFNSEEGCFELVLDHQDDAGQEHHNEMDVHEHHFIHTACCFDKPVPVKKTGLDVPQSPVLLLFTFFNLFTPHSQSEFLTYSDPPSPPVAMQVIRVTELLI
ncbi:MAG: hypothetical protein WD038_01325 [Balneolales bacterium]